MFRNAVFSGADGSGEEGKCANVGARDCETFKGLTKMSAAFSAPSKEKVGNFGYVEHVLSRVECLKCPSGDFISQICNMEKK